MTSQSPEFDNDNTVIVMSPITQPSSSPLPFAAVAVANSHHIPEHVPNWAQQAAMPDEYAPGLNPLVRAASRLLLEIVNLKRTGIVTTLESLRNRLESEIRGFNTQALASAIPASQINAGQYLLCTALDEAVVSALEERKRGYVKNKSESDKRIENQLGAYSEGNQSEDDWQGSSLLSTFHKDTWGGEVFFDVLARAMEQPAGRLYLLELIYLLLSLGFEGKYRVQDRKGSLAVESLRDQIYRQIRLLRGEPSLDLAHKLPQTTFRAKTYVHVPTWLVVPILAFCLAVVFGGFFHVLEGKAHAILAQYEQHAAVGNLFVIKEENASQVADPSDEQHPPDLIEKTPASSRGITTSKK